MLDNLVDIVFYRKNGKKWYNKKERFLINRERVINKMKVEIQEEWFSVAQCKANKNKLYVFGDNLIRAGKGGQATIRDAQNSFGIATKRLPTMQHNAFFRDRDDEFIAVMQDILNLQNELDSSKYDTVVFPKDGLGTGLSRMPETSPKIFKEMNDLISQVFGIDYHF